jgi:hypothetical protein
MIEDGDEDGDEDEDEDEDDFIYYIMENIFICIHFSQI